MKKILSLILLLTITLLSNDNLDLTKDELNYIKTKKVITMCTDPDWMPFEKLENGKHIGMSADYFKLFQKNLNIKIEVIKTKTWAQSLKAAKSRKCDILSLAMETNERKKYLTFTEPYLKVPLVIATKINVPFINDISSLQGKTIGIPKGYAFVEILKNKYPNLNIIEVKNIHDGLKKVNKNELFGYIGTLASIGYMFQNGFTGELKIAGKFDETWELGIGVRKDDKVLFNILQKAIKSVDASKRQHILNNWISIKYEQGVDYTLIWNILIGVFILILFFIYRQILLKKSNNNLEFIVEEKTKELKDINKNLETIIDDKTKRLQHSLNTMSKYIIYSKTDLKGIITEASDAFSEISQYSQDELLGNNHNIIRHPDMPSSIFKEMWKTISKGKIWKGDVKNLKKDGTYYWVASDISPQYDKDGNMESYLAIRHDITAKKNFEQQHIQLIQSEKLASMGEMIGNIAHQWRQPLSVIATAATGMQMQKEYGILNDEKFDKSCETINTNTQYLSKTIDDFRNFIKGKRESKDFNLKDELYSFLNLVEGSIKEYNINIILDLTKDISIHGYNNDLIQCIINIFNNAKDILEEKKIRNRLLFISTKMENKNAIIKIKDNGGGIPLDILPKIFEPYFTTKHQSQGTGLGLHMTYSLIVDGMNGTIDVQNVNYIHNKEEFKGAEFIISIPLKSTK